MEHTPLGNTGVAVSAIGFGGMPLSIQGRPADAEARAVLHAALDGGVTLIDTADVYCLDDDDIGHNERLIAAVLRERRGGGPVYVATKGGLRRPRGAWTTDASPKHLRAACEASLRALGDAPIFLYQLHAPDPRQSFEQSVETMAQLQAEGKIRHVGLSNVSVAQLDAALGIVAVASVQNRLSPHTRDALDEGVVGACAARGITFLAYSPMGGGRLARKVLRQPELVRVAAVHGCTPGAVALAWLRALSPCVLPIPGATKIANARDNAAATAFRLSAHEVAAISRAEFAVD